MKQNNILVLTHWDFDDALIQTYTLPYVKIIASKLPEGSEIHLFTLNKTKKQPVDLSNWHIRAIHADYQRFGMKAAWDWFKIILKLTRLIRKQNISSIHTWCTPAGGMGYILSRLTGKKLILDSFEPHALPMIEGNTWKKGSFAFKILFRLEKLQLKRASEVICAVNGMIEHSQKTYGIKKNRYFSKPACVDLRMFSKEKVKNESLLKKLGLKDKISCVYAGKFGGLYFEEETFTLFKAAYAYWGNNFRVLLLTGHSDEEISTFCQKVGLPLSVVSKKFVRYDKVADYMGLADFALCPMKPLPSRRFGTPIKNGEYWALGLPVVIPPNISDDSDIIKENEIGAIWEETSEAGCMNAIKTIDTLLKNNTREELYQKIRPIAEKYRNYSIADAVYEEIYATEKL
jgi:glycosyltransferase involved in cell wall biosynthesis